ncbi:MAG TPA: hypothetical protein VMS55_08465 [Myxococcota bacterium]|nr:hypothetical protein [Myxococcota bacterium]
MTALNRWMQENCYAGLANCPHHGSLYEGQMWFFRRIFEPWERCPRMLEAFHRAMVGPGGERLDLLGMTAVEPAGRASLENVDPTYAKDFGLIMANMVCGVIQRCAAGDLAVTEILP